MIKRTEENKVIKAPFNFVPLNERPYLPGWADQISHDIPFEDGISGKIKLRITAETPVFIGDEVQEDNTLPCEFCHILDSEGNKKYFIPGTSIKGMLRNVLEIISYGKMTQVQNQSFGIRDLSTGADGLFYRAKVKVDKVHCGWLRMSEDGYLLDDCGFPWRISAEEIDRKFHVGLSDFIKEKSNFKSDENKTAQKKYALFNARADNSFLTDYFEPTAIRGMNAGGRKFVRFERGGMEGTIVFTGQPGVRQKKFNAKKKKDVSSGKLFEFVFPSQPEKSNVPVPKNVFKEFESIHQNSSDYINFRKKQLRKGEEIPVFFIYNEDGEIDTMGISYMYKYPAYNKVFNGIPLPLLNDREKDLAECIFGFTDKADSLKGRVQFSAVALCGVPSFQDNVTIALASPHPSYYPLYLGNGQTWNTSKVRIAGRKRYPVRQQSDMLRNEGTDKMSRIIQPMNVGTTFEGDIHFFNLRPVELGALLSAIDFCRHTECSHNIGQGKPLGYGRVKLTVMDSTAKAVLDGELFSSDKARQSFLCEMEKHFPGWATSPQLTELYAMAKGFTSEKASSFRYMKMSTTGDENEFKQGLKAYSQGLQLGTFSQIMSGNVPRVQQLSNVGVDEKREDVELQLAKEQERRALEQAKAEEKQKLMTYQSLLDSARQALKSEVWEEADLKAEEAKNLYPEKAEAADLKAEIIKAKELADFRKGEEAAAIQKLAQPLSEIIQGKTSAGNLVGTTVKWLKADGHSFGMPEQAAFANEAKNLSAGEKKKLKSKLSDLEKIAGKECVDQLRKELGIV